MSRRRKQQRGSAIVEFVLTGIPMIFIWISVVQMCIGMWHYHTLQYAVKAAAAYITHHGSGCAAIGNTCANQIKDAAAVLRATAIGIPVNEVNVTFTAMQSNGAVGATVTCQLDACLTNTTTWPPTAYNAPGLDITIKANYVFRSAMCMVAPGPGAGPVNFGVFNLPGYSRQFILF